MSETPRCKVCGDLLWRRLNGKPIYHHHKEEKWKSKYDALTAEHDALRDQLDDLKAQIMVVLDCVDYTSGSCKPNEPIGGVLPRLVIDNIRAKINALSANAETPKNNEMRFPRDERGIEYFDASGGYKPEEAMNE